MKHSMFGPSSADRWTKCPTSAKLIAALPERPSSSYAVEGTNAHKVLSDILSGEVACGDTEMEKHALAAIKFINLNISPKAVYWLETTIGYESIIPGGFGTCDFFSYDNEELFIADYKYGKGVVVDTFSNSQLILYALGIVETFGFVPKTVTMSIMQPRRENFNKYSIDLDELLGYRSFYANAYKKAVSNEDHRKAGKHCRFCEIKTNCDTYDRAKFNKEIR